MYVFGGFIGLVMFGLGIGIAPSPVRQVTTEYHYNQTLQFENSDIVRNTDVVLPIVGDAVVECTVSDEWALQAIVTCQWLQDLQKVSITVVNDAVVNLPIEVGVSVYPVNYTPLVRNDSK